MLQKKRNKHIYYVYNDHFPSQQVSDVTRHKNVLNLIFSNSHNFESDHEILVDNSISDHNLIFIKTDIDLSEIVQNND